MRYQFVEWLHEFDSEPVAIIQELTDDGWEVRKIEVFPGGSVGLASSRGESGGSALAELPSPDLDAINRSPEFNGVAIGPRLFEALWREAAGAGRRPCARGRARCRPRGGGRSPRGAVGAGGGGVLRWAASDGVPAEWS